MKIILVSHGDFAKGLLASAQMIIGEQEKVSAFGLYRTETTEILRARLEEAIKDSNENEEILFLTDLFHGTPFNVVVSLMNEYPIYHITGINMPLFLEIVTKRGLNTMTCEAICAEVIKNAQGSISDVKDYLKEVI